LPGKSSHFTLLPGNPQERRLFGLLILVLLILVGVLVWPLLRAQFQPVVIPPTAVLPTAAVPGTPADSTPQQSPAPNTPVSASETPVVASTEALPVPLPAQISPLRSGLESGAVILAMDDGEYSHLFAFQPGVMPFVRLTSGAWSDMTPAVSPDGKTVAFASNRDGQWDLYMMELASGRVTRLTETREYDGAPSWAPDGKWLAYETYVGDGENGNLEVSIRSITSDQAPIRLTEHPAADFSPSWSPGGRLLAFVSSREGKNEIWLADLDQTDSRFQKAGKMDAQEETHPAWSPDGSSLAWIATTQDGLQNLVVWDLTKPGSSPVEMGSAGWPAWTSDGRTILAVSSNPNQDYFSAYDVQSTGLALPSVPLPGSVSGLTWAAAGLPLPLAAPLGQAALLTPTAIWEAQITPLSGVPEGRQRLVPLPDVLPDGSVLQDLVDESFNSLRRRVAAVVGWDFLSTLESSYIPLTAPVGPGDPYDWLYTGRAFAFNRAPVDAGWLAVVRQDYGRETYWRIYLRARFQDGTVGMPVHDLPWDLNARSGGDPIAYEQGGAMKTRPPAGYWVDFTRLARAYGWERLPALSTWLTDITAARFNQYVLRDNHSWLAAMEELYPRQALDTATPFPTSTWTTTPTITPSPTATFTRTPRPTRTSSIHRSTSTPSPTAQSTAPPGG
jgi:TolB protein